MAWGDFPTGRQVLVLGLAIGLAQTLHAALAFNLMAHGDLAVFGSYWASGWAANHGLNPFTQYPLTWTFDYRWLTIRDVNLNPPTVLPLFQVFALFDPEIGARYWTLISGALYCSAAFALVKEAEPQNPWKVLWLFLLPAFADTLILGQNYTLLFALGVAIWLSLKNEREITAALLIGVLIAFKPNFGLWPLLLFAGGHRKIPLISLATASALYLAALAIYGPTIFVEWLAAAAADTQHIAVGTNDVSLNGYLYRLGIQHGMIASAIIAVGALAWVYKARLDLRELSALAIVLSVFLSPLGWAHYLLLVVPALYTRKLSWPLLIAAVMLLIPMHLGWYGHDNSHLGMALEGLLFSLPCWLMLCGFFPIRASHTDLRSSRPQTAPSPRTP